MGQAGLRLEVIQPGELVVVIPFSVSSLEPQNVNQSDDPH